MTVRVLGEFPPSCVSDITPTPPVAEAHPLPPAQFNLNLSLKSCYFGVIALTPIIFNPFLERFRRPSLLRELPHSTPQLPRQMQKSFSVN